MNKFYRYKNRLEQGYGLSRSEQTEWVLLAKEWMKLYQEAENHRMYDQVVRVLRLYGNGAKPKTRVRTMEDDHAKIAEEILK